MDQQNADANEKITYFVIFNHQEGEITPAYSFMDKFSLEQASSQGIVLKAVIVPTKLYTHEEVQELITKYTPAE